MTMHISKHHFTELPKMYIDKKQIQNYVDATEKEFYELFVV